MHFHKVDKKLLLSRCQELAKILESIPLPEETRPELFDIINGRLRGGNKDKYHPIKPLDSTRLMHSVCKSLQDSSITSSSAAVKLLARLGSFFLFPLAYDAESCGYRTDEYDLFTEATKREVDSNYASESDSEGDSDICDSDDDSSLALSDFDSCRPSTSSTFPPSIDQKPALDISVSEIAEAYYAHQVIDQSDYSTVEGHRLDYVITQMDIARMARNASRHLDVDSILNLPTVTYRSRASTQVCSIVGDNSRDPDEAWSFVMVPQEKSAVNSSPTEDATNDCVICLEHFQEGDRLRVLPCDHSFHVGCIDRWLSGSHSHQECFTSGCPTCKKRPSEMDSSSPDGSVPSWAFAKLGAELARSSSSEST
jgi:hypothetical protein